MYVCVLVCDADTNLLRIHPGLTLTYSNDKTLANTNKHKQTQVAPDAIHGTLSALGPDLDLLAAFRVPPKAASASAAFGYSLRAAVCYVGHHYLAFVLAEELGLWLCFDDADISLVSVIVVLCVCV